MGNYQQIFDFSIGKAMYRSLKDEGHEIVIFADI